MRSTHFNGQSPYAATKIGSDAMAMSFYFCFRPAGLDRPPV